jgi:hypothetical protein
MYWNMYGTRPLCSREAGRHDHDSPACATVRCATPWRPALGSAAVALRPVGDVVPTGDPRA